MVFNKGIMRRNNSDLVPEHFISNLKLVSLLNMKQIGTNYYYHY